MELMSARNYFHPQSLFYRHSIFEVETQIRTAKGSNLYKVGRLAIKGLLRPADNVRGQGCPPQWQLPKNTKHLYIILYNVGPTSKTLGRRCTNVIQIFCVFRAVLFSRGDCFYGETHRLSIFWWGNLAVDMPVVHRGASGQESLMYQEGTSRPAIKQDPGGPHCHQVE